MEPAAFEVAGAPRDHVAQCGASNAHPRWRFGAEGYAADARLGPEPFMRPNRRRLAEIGPIFPGRQLALYYRPQHGSAPGSNAPWPEATAQALIGQPAARTVDAELPERHPGVKVRAGRHGGFERVTFEWPQAVEYNVVQHADQVTVAFSRRGSDRCLPHNDRLGTWVLGARAEERRRDRPRRLARFARVSDPFLQPRRRSHRGDRRVRRDGTANRRAAPRTEQGSIQELRQALEQRDAAIAEPACSRRAAGAGGGSVRGRSRSGYGRPSQGHSPGRKDKPRPPDYATGRSHGGAFKRPAQLG